MTGQTVIAYWLIPSEPAHSFFQRIINHLARRYDAPVFEPHLTIYIGADRADAAEKALWDAARKCNPLGLIPIGTDQSDEFIKTLFVQFATSAELRKASDIICEAANDSSQYELKPHLSLLYKSLAAETRRELAASIDVAFSEVTFNAIKAVRCHSPTRTRAEVDAWQIITEEKLSR